VTQTRCITVDLLSTIRKDCQTSSPLPSQGAVGWSTGNRFHSRPVLLDPYAHYIAPHVPGQGECSFFELRGSVLAPGLDQGDSGFTITSLLEKRKRRCPHSRKSNSKASLADSGRRMCKSFVASWWANYALPPQAQCDSHQHFSAGNLAQTSWRRSLPGAHFKVLTSKPFYGESVRRRAQELR
jgi:hypothetical protein